MFFYIEILAILIVLNLCIGQQPADKGVNDKTKEILDYIAKLLKQSTFVEDTIFFHLNYKNK